MLLTQLAWQQTKTRRLFNDPAGERPPLDTSVHNDANSQRLIIKQL